MAKLPSSFSLQAIPVRAALSEGRTADAVTLLVDILRAGNADAVFQRIAADLLRPSKQKRGRKKSLPRHWHEIGEQFHWMRDDGVRYEDALRRLADRFGYSETHIRTAVATYDTAKDENDLESPQLKEVSSPKAERRKRLYLCNTKQ